MPPKATSIGFRIVRNGVVIDWKNSVLNHLLETFNGKNYAMLWLNGHEKQLGVGGTALTVIVSE
jgi:hypothetical protein